MCASCFAGIENERGIADLEGNPQRRRQISQCSYVSILLLLHC